jgi:hypothetical protein
MYIYLYMYIYIYVYTYTVYIYDVIIEAYTWPNMLFINPLSANPVFWMLIIHHDPTSHLLPDPHHVPSGTHMERSTMWNGKMHELNGDFQQQTVSSFTRGYHLFLASVDFPKHGWELSFPRTKWWLLVQFCFKKNQTKSGRLKHAKVLPFSMP